MTSYVSTEFLFDDSLSFDFCKGDVNDDKEAFHLQPDSSEHNDIDDTNGSNILLNSKESSLMRLNTNSNLDSTSNVGIVKYFIMNDIQRYEEWIRNCNSNESTVQKVEETSFAFSEVNHNQSSSRKRRRISSNTSRMHDMVQLAPYYHTSQCASLTMKLPVISVKHKFTNFARELKQFLNNADFSHSHNFLSKTVDSRCTFILRNPMFVKSMQGSECLLKYYDAVAKTHPDFVFSLNTNHERTQENNEVIQLELSHRFHGTRAHQQHWCKVVEVDPTSRIINFFKAGMYSDDSMKDFRIKEENAYHHGRFIRVHMEGTIVLRINKTTNKIVHFEQISYCVSLDCV